MSISSLPRRGNPASELAGLLMAGIDVLRLLEEVLPEAAQEVEAHSHSLATHFQTLSQDAASSSAASAIVEDLQFQDRNTQVIQDAVQMLSAYRTLLESVAQPLVAPEVHEEATAHILSHITLSDIRNRYLALQGKGVMQASQNENDGIEIF